ncbi:hypothetical protein MPTK1_6g17320 [Marchantia polymorpha subsp. ruderalis]|uniref:Uncharacterized protein n=2 Tax=Marchantia polymorpha TaxID=3197 RepID=A0AAF6BSZ8_MARPO|nr:hypothetical protein MARPO_0184s0018 [Marchantia polymorpha]BBN15132.1 hypothetical protein Mp_6g17320 [Marchantia polymorpha subsp. ruderalis]|eukprot:PTQ27780.1 hypothetical protein MARPO_0184s0018 [Marchantia polymorpha]
MGAEAENVDFRSLFEEKEKELVGICERQIEFFHQQVLERDRHIKDLSAKFSQLKEDFKYNLELLDERDAELTHYEAELAALQISIKAARDEHEETQDRLTEAESQRLEEKRRSEDKDKVHQQALATLRQQIESFQFSREQLMSMHKEAFETASAELMSEVEKRQADLDNHSKVLESQYHDKLRIHELQSQLALDAVENKLSQAERKVTQLETELDIEVQKRRGDANMERELRAEIKEKDGIIKRMSKELAELQAENDDVHSRADNADYQAQQVNKKLQVVETEHRKQTLQMRLQIENFQKRLETAESRLGEWDGKRPGEIQGYLEKVAQLEQAMVTEDNQLKLKLEGVETYIRESMQHQEQKVQVAVSFSRTIPLF